MVFGVCWQNNFDKSNLAHKRETGDSGGALLATKDMLGSEY
jgi:hypothetical protein